MSSSAPEASERRELFESVMLGLRRLSTRTVMFHQSIADQVGLNATDHKGLDILGETGPITAGQLADEAGLTTGATTRLIDRLEKAGLVRRDRDPQDRRQVIIQPVAGTEFERKMQRLFTPLAQAMTSELDRYSDAELALILDFITRCRSISHEQALRLREMSTEKLAENAG